MENINKKRARTTIRFKMAGIECIRVIIMILRPSFLPINLRGRRARNALSAFNDFNCDELPIFWSIQSIIDTTTIKKSNWFSPWNKYAPFPSISSGAYIKF